VKRILLFIGTNLAVLALLAVVASVFGIDRFASQYGLNLGGLLAFAALFGFGGAFISLALSKRMALWTTGAVIIEEPKSDVEAWLVHTVEQLARRSGIQTPDVAIYPGRELNAFATGARRNHALVAVSEGLLRGMRRDEAEAVLAHEVAHVANGDMVTMALLQGVLNTFVIAAARALAWVVSRSTGRDGESFSPMIYFATSLVAQIAFGMLASLVVMAFSRHREFRADAGSAELLGAAPMIAALQRLGGDESEPELPRAVRSFGIRGGGGLARMFASHPPLEDRIAALRAPRQGSSRVAHSGG